jgi:dipeptidyl aminopeptidase/acylaminoacyl peptidase
MLLTGRVAASLALLLALTVGRLGCGPSSAPTAPAATSDADRLDKTIPGAGITIGGILYRPSLAPGQVRPAIVVLHGHLPYGTSGAASVEGVARRYRDRGYIALAMSMRGWPPSGGSDDCALEQPDDVVRVVEWLKREPGVDAAHVGLMGYSKGGQMALLAAARGASVQAVVAYYPPTDLALWKATTGNAATINYVTSLCEPPPGLTPRSPLAQAALIVTPVLLVHGDADPNVPLEQSQVMAAAMRSSGRQVELFVVPGAGHGFTVPELEIALPVVDAFLSSRLALRVSAQ